MDIERERLIEIVVSIAVVLVFVGVLVAIGLHFDGDNLPPEGGLAIIVAITVFVLVMAAVGVGLAYYLNPD